MIRPSRAWTFAALIAALAFPGVAIASQSSDGPAATETGAADPDGARPPGPGPTQQPQPQPHALSVGLRGLYASMADAGLESAPGFTAFGIVDLATDLELEVEAGLTRITSNVGTLPAGDLMLIPVRATVRLQIWRLGSALPYVGAGAGFYLTDFSLDDATRTALEQLGFTVDQTVESSVGVHAGGGVEWQRGRWKFGVDAKYQAVSADASSRVVDTVSGLVITDATEADLDGVWVAFGVRVALR